MTAIKVMWTAVLVMWALYALGIALVWKHERVGWVTMGTGLAIGFGGVIYGLWSI